LNKKIGKPLFLGNCYIHDPKAIEAWYAILCIAVNPMMLILFTNLKEEGRNDN